MSVSAMDSNEKPRPHVCPMCFRGFHRLEHLKRHERSHTKEKPFACSSCGRCFARRDLLLRHELKLHDTTAMSAKRRKVSEISVPAKPKVASHKVRGSNSSRPRANTLPTAGLLETVDPAILSMSPALYQNGDDEDEDEEMDGSAYSWLNTHPIHSPSDASSSLHTPALTQDALDSNYGSGSEMPALQWSKVSEQGRLFLAASPDFATLNGAPPWQLPSDAYITKCLVVYFQRCHPHLPIFHLPTLFLNSPSDVLILSIAAIGACYFDDSESHRALAHDIFHAAKRLAQSTLDAQRVLALNGQATSRSQLQLVQALVLNVVYGLFCGDSLAIEIAFGEIDGIVTLARSLGMLQEEPSSKRDYTTWSIAESSRRTIFALHYISSRVQTDFAQISALVNEDIGLRLPCEEALFAMGEEEWAKCQDVTEQRAYYDTLLVLYESIPAKTSLFGCLALLSGLQLDVHCGDAVKENWKCLWLLNAAESHPLQIDIGLIFSQLCQKKYLDLGPLKEHAWQIGVTEAALDFHRHFLELDRGNFAILAMEAVEVLCAVRQNGARGFCPLSTFAISDSSMILVEWMLFLERTITDEVNAGTCSTIQGVMLLDELERNILQQVVSALDGTGSFTDNTRLCSVVGRYVAGVLGRNEWSGVRGNVREGILRHTMQAEVQVPVKAGC